MHFWMVSVSDLFMNINLFACSVLSFSLKVHSKFITSDTEE